MRRRVTTADYYRYYRIPTHLVPSRSVSSHAILLVLRFVDASLSVILRAIESWQIAIVDTLIFMRRKRSSELRSDDSVTNLDEISATQIYSFARCVEPKMSLLQICAHFCRSMQNSICQVTK